MQKITLFSTYLALICNILLFIIKIIAGLMSGSISLISDAINSFADIFTSIAIMFSVKIAHKRADETHPFGHHRAEPLGGMISAIVAVLLGFEIIKEAIMMIFDPYKIKFSTFVFAVILVTILTKLVLYIIFRKVSKKHNTPAVRALSYDSINDVFVTIGVLLSMILSYYKIPYIDAIVAILIGIWVIRNGIIIGLENIHFLMGRKPEKEVVEHIIKIAKKIEGVKGTNDVFAHFVGHYVHVEIHIEVNKKLSLQKAHNIGKKVKEKIESLDLVDRAFIHIDPK